MGVFFVLKIQVSSSQEEKPWLDFLIRKFVVATLGLHDLWKSAKFFFGRPLWKEEILRLEQILVTS
jgi:hypothetical protein